MARMAKRSDDRVEKYDSAAGLTQTTMLVLELPPNESWQWMSTF
jgi:hypothetical protein